MPPRIHLQANGNPPLHHAILECTAAGRTTRLSAVIGRGGISDNKREGDGCTPLGTWRLREVWYRQDRLPHLASALPIRTIKPHSGWCDDPASPHYNRPIDLRLPPSRLVSHERMWREDNLYDLLVVVGYNDDPPIPALGSAIFMHVAPPKRAATQGCIGLDLGDLLEVLKIIDGSTHIVTARTAPAAMP